MPLVLSYSNLTILELEQLRRADFFSGGKALTVGDSGSLGAGGVGPGDVNTEPYVTGPSILLDNVTAITPPSQPGQGLGTLTTTSDALSDTCRWYGPTFVTNGPSGVGSGGSTWTDSAKAFISAGVMAGDILLVKPKGSDNDNLVATITTVTSQTVLTLDAATLKNPSNGNVLGTSTGNKYTIVRPSAIQLLAVPTSAATAGSEQTFLTVLPQPASTKPSDLAATVSAGTSSGSFNVFTGNLATDFSAAAPSGSAAHTTTLIGSTLTLTNLTSMVSGHQHRFITISGSSNAGNNGTFEIVAFNSATSVDISNASGVASDSGSLTWAVTPIAVGDVLTLTNFSPAQTFTIITLNPAAGINPYQFIVDRPISGGPYTYEIRRSLHNITTLTTDMINAVRVQNLVPPNYALDSSVDRSDSVFQFSNNALRTGLDKLGYRIVLYPDNGLGRPDLTKPIADVHPIIDNAVDAASQRMTFDFTAGVVRLSTAPKSGGTNQIKAGTNPTTGRLNLFAVYWAIDTTNTEGVARGSTSHEARTSRPFRRRGFTGTKARTRGPSRRTRPIRGRRAA